MTTQQRKEAPTGDGWTLISEKTTANVSRSWTDNGKHMTEEEYLVGTPANVKRQCEAKYPGEATCIETVHTIKKYAREFAANTTSGTIKQRQECIVQEDGFGDGKSIGSVSQPSRVVSSDDIEEPKHEKGNEAGNEHKTGTLKNMIDQLFASQRVQTVLITAAIILGAVGATTAFIALNR